MHTFPILHTPRLTLRQLTVDDFPALVKYANNKKISDQVINIPYPYQEMNAVFRLSYVVQGFKAKTRFVFAIILKENQELAGEISLHLNQQYAEMGYWVGEPFWNQGIATEAAGAIIQFGFQQLGLQLIYATCHIDNTASGKVLLHHGMVKHSEQGNVAQYRLLNSAEN